ncbi:MAG: beta-N-acetylhexosaminidase [Bacteroidaceae bacterium]|nr:beta-N-acetylhexosaminidase [Bacteroidaceae bacterium]
MKLRKLSVLLCVALGCTLAVHAQKVAIHPTPVQCEISETKWVPLNNVVIASSDKNAQEWAARHLKQWYGKEAPKVVELQQSTEAMGDEEYELKADESGIRIKAKSLQGVRYALYTLRQAAIPQRGTLKVEGWMVPECTIKDRPGLTFRGIHICWFHETEVWEVERLIRMAAYYKLNYAVVEPWGTFRSKVAPWYGWPDGTMTQREIKRLKRIADDLGITLIPQINVFGHATASRGGAGKHSTLEFNPKYQPLFEPLNGWNWCLSNPETRKVLTRLIAELHEAFGNPPYFHIGGDEAMPPSCPQCTDRPYSDLFLEHIKAMNDVIVARGARTMMWHDMLLQRGDERWQGFYANGSPETAEGFRQFPRNIIICDWFYDEAKKDYPTLDYFKQLGFPVLTCPWHNWNGTIAQGRHAHKSGINGILGTLWHHHFGNNLINIFFTLANAAWNADSPFRLTEGSVQTHLRQIGWDMKTKNPRHTGTFYDEIPPEPFLNN